MRRQGTPVSREALYEEVWTDAVTVVAPRYGLSDVGLVNICRKLGIPVPPRGYWAKVKAGRPTRKVPLPPSPPARATSPGRYRCPNRRRPCTRASVTPSGRPARARRASASPRSSSTGTRSYGPDQPPTPIPVQRDPFGVTRLSSTARHPGTTS
jgi:hypothetical protein